MSHRKVSQEWEERREEEEEERGRERDGMEGWSEGDELRGRKRTRGRKRRAGEQGREEIIISQSR